MGQLILSFVLLGLYLVPTIVAICKHHRHWGGILCLNLVAGWSGIGWVAAFIWAFYGAKLARQRA